jgi:hypothetical protein
VKAKALPDGAKRIDAGSLVFRGAERRRMRFSNGRVKFALLKRDHPPFGVAASAFERTINAVNCALVGGGDAADFDVAAPLDDN